MLSLIEAGTLIIYSFIIFFFQRHWYEFHHSQAPMTWSLDLYSSQPCETASTLFWLRSSSRVWKLLWNRSVIGQTPLWLIQTLISAAPSTLLFSLLDIRASVCTIINLAPRYWQNLPAHSKWVLFFCVFLSPHKIDFSFCYLIKQWL
jgi:hypothetical protein